MFWRNRDQNGDPVPEEPETPQQEQPQPEPTLSFWFWLSGPEVPKTADSETPVNNDSKEPSTSWFGSSNTSNQQPALKTTLSWFWPFSSNPEPELDSEDTDHAVMFREARTALENSRGNAHYAVKYVRGEDTAELAVIGTATEQVPVKFSKKEPALPNELLEAALISAKARRCREEARKEEVKREEAKKEELKREEAKQEAKQQEKINVEKQKEAPPVEPTGFLNQKNQSTSQDRPTATNQSSEPRPNETESSPGLTFSARFTNGVQEQAKGREGELKEREPSKEESKDGLKNGTKEAEITNQPSRANSKASSLHSHLTLPLVLPDMNHNFREITFITKARLLGEKLLKGEQTSERHLYLTPSASLAVKKRNRKNVVVISVHSLLPPKFVRNYIAQSTGSAKQFGQRAMDAAARWFGDETANISAICLEGQGTITERVHQLFRLLRNWRHEINSADVVFFASSSMATPAALMLFSAMHQSEEFDLNRKKLGMLSMAGIHCGPYPGLNARVVIRAYYPAENEIIKELFELQKPGSELALQLSADTQYLCEQNVKIAVVGALNDQFVPLFLAVALGVSHPNIYKSIYIDEHSAVPPFMAKLFLVMLTMQNVGYLDQNMVTDLSERLQGPVNVNYGSHGRIFDHDDVYDVGLRFTMETTSLVRSRLLKLERPHTSRVGPAHKPVAVGAPDSQVWQSDKNLYHLPWNVRGVVNDLIAIKNIENLLLLMDLVEEYRRWEPTKAWREMKQCFAAFEELSLDDLML